MATIRLSGIRERTREVIGTMIPFSKDQYDSIYPEGIENHYWNHARNRIIGRLLEKHHLSQGKILEVGCGKGVVIDYLRTQEIDCFGVELSDVPPIPRVADRIVVSMDALNLPLDFRDSIETILLLDVIEHFNNPAEFIQSILSSYSSVKRVVVTVPARQELWTNYDVYNGHFKRYRLRDIAPLVDSFAQVEEVGYFNHVLYPVFWLFAKGFKNRATIVRAPSGMVIYFHRFLSLILQSDYTVIPKEMPGTSILALLSIRRK